MTKRIIDLTNKVFGRLRVISFSHKDIHNKAHWLCRCKCGKEKTIASSSLRLGYTNSCGCLCTERLKSNFMRNKVSEFNKRIGRWSGKNNPWYDKKGSHNPAYKKEVRNKIAKTKIGDKNPAWNGGTSYNKYCEVFRVKSFREIIFERDGYICQSPLCNKKTNRICLHHINYDKKECSLSNLITLCISCNSRANTNRGYWEKFYINIVNGLFSTNVA